MHTELGFEPSVMTRSVDRIPPQKMEKWITDYNNKQFEKEIERYNFEQKKKAIYKKEIWESAQKMV